MTSRTNVEKDCAVEPLIDDMFLEDLIVQRTRGTLGDRHRGVELSSVCMCMCMCIPFVDVKLSCGRRAAHNQLRRQRTRSTLQRMVMVKMVEGFGGERGKK